jgi:hypothetical protein
MNNRKRIFENKKYLDFIRSLPCAVSGKAVESVQAHHTAPTGRQAVQNDYYALPLEAFYHTPNGNHITASRLTGLIKENIEERIIFYMSLYIEYLEGRYDPEVDRDCNYMTLRRKLEGINTRY